VTDILESVRKVDTRGMYDKICAFPDQVEDAARLARSFKPDLGEKIENIIICGMGGSAIGGDLAKDFLTDRLPIPLEVNRDYGLPAYAGRKSLVIISSYSGNTEETLSAMDEAEKRKTVLAAFTTGGEVGRLAGASGIPVLRIPEGFQPREAVAYSFIPILYLLGSFCGNLDLESETHGAVSVLRRLSGTLGNPDRDSEAYGIASALYDRFPVIYSQSQYFRSVVTRWRSQLAENSKILSSSHLLPELCHNEIVGWRKNIEIPPGAQAVFLQDRAFHDRISLRWELTRQIIMNSAGRVIEVESEGEGLLARMLSLIYKGDFVSLYLSCLYGVDPTPVENIDFLKKRLSAKN